MQQNRIIPVHLTSNMPRKPYNIIHYLKYLYYFRAIRQGRVTTQGDWTPVAGYLLVHDRLTNSK